jgi:DNA-binding protein H-NS
MARTATARSDKSDTSNTKLESKSVNELIALHEEVSEALSAKVLEQCRSLESELAKLNRFHGSSPRSKSAGDGRTPVAPKYRNPENLSETWAGRGLKPRWLKAAIEAGIAADDFLISRSTPSPKVVELKKLGKSRKSQG